MSPVTPWIVDAHQHFWRLDRGDYVYPAPSDKLLYRDFMPADLEPALAAAGVAATVVVQATNTLAETAFLLELAAAHRFVAGVVGWWHPGGEGRLDRALALPGSERLVGIRPMLQRWDDVAWLLEPDSLCELADLAERGLVFEALVDSRHLATIRALCAALPGLKVVIDHMGKPWRHPDRLEEWSSDMQALGDAANCAVKVSGFPFAAASAGRPEDLVERLRGWFGTGRLMWGSDWPVAEREGGYHVVLDGMWRLFSDTERAAVFHGNAATLYGLSIGGPGQPVADASGGGLA